MKDSMGILLITSHIDADLSPKPFPRELFWNKLMC